jgi:hypothetical protein
LSILHEHQIASGKANFFIRGPKQADGIDLPAMVENARSYSYLELRERCPPGSKAIDEQPQSTQGTGLSACLHLR